MPKVSVIIPSYNHEKYIYEAIESVLNQTYQDFEIVITDDGSTDNTVNIIKKFTDPRIKLFCFPINQGAAIAANNCLRESQGELIAMLSSDDVFALNKLERQVSFLEDHPEIGAVFSYTQTIDDDSNEFNQANHSYQKIFIQSNRNRFAWLNYFFFHGNCLCHPSALIRKKCYEEIGQYDERFAQLPDLDFWIRLCTNYEIYIIPEKLLKFRVRQNEENASGNRPEVTIRSSLEYKQILNHYLTPEISEYFHEIFPDKRQELVEKELTSFLIAKLAITVNNPRHQSFGIDTLYQIFKNSNPNLINKIKEKYNFDIKDLVQLTGEYDVFGSVKFELLTSQLQETQAELEESKSALLHAQTLVTAMQSSKFWKLRMLWFRIKAFLNLVPASEMFAPDKVLDSIHSQEELSIDNSPKMFAFISGCPGDAYRYRCHHQAEILKYLGYTVDVYEPMVFLYNKLLLKYKIIIAHRVPHTYEFEQFVFKAKKLGIKVIFDTDDLIFEPSCLSQIHAYTQMDEHGKRIYENGVKQYRKSISLCDYITVSTDKLQQKIKESFPNKFSIILRNRISHEMEQGAIKARKSYVPNDGMLRIAYFSGTKTHVKDFAECVVSLKIILAEFPNVRLMVVGHLDIPKDLQEVSSQIECIPYMPWRDLPKLYRKVDINLAPLEKNNDFTESKSELKYFEAALLSVPTIASNTSAFRIAIQDGVNGLLCNNLDEWKNALYQLVTNHKLRKEMGQKAFEDVNNRYLTRVAASETMKQWKNLLGGSLSPSKPLAIAFILRAPIAQTGGGYKQIFYLAHYLSQQGHNVNIYVEPVAHLIDFSPEQVKQFCEDNFGKSQAIIHSGYTEILDSDVAIATNWPTAEVVDQLVNTRFKAYFIQDYEPYFYEPEDICFQQAEATYNLPLGMICIGKYLAEILGKRNRTNYSYIDFSINEVFLAKNPILERHLSIDKPCSILFFARPHIPRRNFTLGVEALNKLYQYNPNVNIKLYGLEEPLELPFHYENLGVLSQAETAEAMRSSDIHLSFSMTNISTVVFEAMACGCATVEVDVPPVRGMVKEGTCLLCEPNPESVFNALMTLINNPTMKQKIATSGYESVKKLTVQNMCIQFERILMEYTFQTRS